MPLDILGRDANQFPGGSRYVRLTFRAPFTPPISNVDTIQAAIAKALRGNSESSWILAQGPTLPVKSATTLGFGTVFSDAVIRTTAAARTWTDLLAPLRSFAGIELVQADLVEGSRAPSVAADIARDQPAPLTGTVTTLKGVGVLLGLVAIAAIALTVAPFIPRRS